MYVCMYVCVCDLFVFDVSRLVEYDKWPKKTQMS